MTTQFTDPAADADHTCPDWLVHACTDPNLHERTLTVLETSHADILGERVTTRLLLERYDAGDPDGSGRAVLDLTRAGLNPAYATPGAGMARFLSGPYGRQAVALDHGQLLDLAQACIQAARAVNAKTGR